MEGNALKMPRRLLSLLTSALFICAWHPLARASEEKKIPAPVLRVHPVPAASYYREPLPLWPDLLHQQQGMPIPQAISGNLHLVYTRATLDPNTPDKDLFIIKEDGTWRTQLAASADKEYFEGETNGRIIYTVLKDGFQLDIWSVKKDGSGALPLATDDDDERFIAISGNRVIYAKNFEDWSQWGDFYSVTCDGNDRQLLAEGVIYGDVVGEWLVYEREVNPGNQDLYSVKTDGSLTALLAGASDPEWYQGSFKGWVIFHLSHPSNCDIYAMPADGALDFPVRLAASPENDFFAGVGSDRIFYYRMVDGNNTDLYSVFIDGNGTIALSTGPSQVTFFGVYGNRVLLQKDVGGQELFSVCLDGSNEIQLTGSKVSIMDPKILAGWVIYLDGYADLYRVFSVKITGGTPIMLSDWLDYRNKEWIDIDPVSKKVIISKRRNSQIDLTSISPNGTGSTRFAGSSYPEAYLCSTANCFIYSRLVNDQWDLYSYNFKLKLTKTLAKTTSYHETVPYKGGGPVQ